MIHKKFLIYGLVDPTTNEIRYVGKTVKGLSRPKQHFCKSSLNSNKQTHKVKWLRKLKTQGLVPHVVILERGFSSEEELLKAEVRWIALGREALGDRLTNITIGGEGATGFRFTREQREYLSSKRKALFLDPAFRAAYKEVRKAMVIDRESASRKQKELWSQAEYREKLTRSIREFVSKPEHKAKLSRVFKDVYNRPGYRELASERRRQERNNPDIVKRRKENQKKAFARPEHRKLMSEQQKARWQDPIYRARILEAKRAAVQRPEVRERLRIAGLRRHRAKMLINLLSKSA